MGDPEGDLVRGLRALAKDAKQDTFVVHHDSVNVKVSYSGGSSSSLGLSVAYDAHAKRVVDVAAATTAYRESARGGLVATRPMKIELTPEGITHIRAKDDGVNREHQTGDSKFDAKVYVDSPTVDATVLHAVLNEDVRSAVLELFAVGMRTVMLDGDDGRVVGSLTEFAAAKEEPKRAERMIAAFAKLAQSLPPVKASGEKHAPAPLARTLKIGGVVSMVLLFAGMPLLQVMGNLADCMEDSSDGEGQSFKDGCGSAPLMGLSGGLGMGLLAMVLATHFLVPKLRGRSDSSTKMAMLYGVSFLLTAEITFLAVSAVAFALH